MRPLDAHPAMMSRSTPPITQGSRRGSRIRLLVGLLIGAGAVYAVASAAGGVADSLHALEGARPGWLVLSVVAETASYATLGLLLRRLTAFRVDRLTGIRLGLVVAGLGNLLPASPAEGLTLAGAELRRRGVDNRRSVIALALSQWYSTRALFGIAAIDALAIATLANVRFHHSNARFVLAAIAIAALGVLALTAWLASRRETMEFISRTSARLQFWKPTGVAAELRERGATWHREISEILGPTRNRALIGGLALGSCLADGTCFRLALGAVGIHLAAGLFLFAYAIGTISAMIPLLPAGLGVVETIVPALLHHERVPLATGLAGVLAYRALSTLLPAIAGTIALIRLRRYPTPAANT